MKPDLVVEFGERSSALQYNLTAVFAWAADCILLSILLFPLWLRNRDRLFILLWSAALALMGLGLLGLTYVTPQASLLFALPIAALVVAEALSAAGLISLYGEDRPLRFTVLSLSVWFATFVLFNLSAFGPVSAVASYFLAVIVIAVYALHFLWYQATFEEVRFHRSIPVIFLLEAVSALAIAVFYVLESPAAPHEGTLTSITLISGFVLFSAKVCLAVWLSIEKYEFHLKKLAFHDPLTGILNRRGFFERINERLKSAAPSDLFAYLTIDIDHFKSVNDRFGHSAGDDALVCFARSVEEAVDRPHLFGRTGGEEFAILLKVDDARSAIGFAERIRHWLADAGHCHTSSSTPLTVSIGIAIQQGAGFNLETMLSQSDRALYEAKNSGRDCVVAYGLEKARPTPDRLKA
ncbi:GGDEF domain-containing protein [Martelella radicis]|uniref:diguanylate cyclase n=1 Tax=Martelella radicis TaxID=1397476 RepID=A0A7W6KIE6_9HYPH|nr:GGDEF domain-containing protein [Martelella radicis]MBB4120518.1 diguanylate cyclase (GGDEF)-like protein [Martelella radicis]